MTTIAIIANGPSARHHALAAKHSDIVIAVNGAHAFVPRADYWFTLDLSPSNRRIMNRPRDGVEYVVACRPDAPLPAHVTRLTRVESTAPAPNRPCTPHGWLRRWRSMEGLATDPSKIHTGNSAYGALGLAFHLLSGQCGKILLCGVDATQDQRFTGGRPGELSHLPLLFDSAKPQLQAAGIEVYTFSDHDRLGFPQWHESSSSAQGQTRLKK